MRSFCGFTVAGLTDLVVVEDHLEPVEVEPPPRLPALQVVVEVPGGEAEGVKLLLWSEQ